MKSAAVVCVIVCSAIPALAQLVPGGAIPVPHDKIVTGPNGMSINCADFKKVSAGLWQSGPLGTLTYPDRPGSFSNNIFSSGGGININGVDIGEFLDKNCGA